MSEIARLPDPAALVGRLPAGSALIVRHPDAARRQDLAAACVRGARAHRVRLLVAEDWRAAAALRLDGVHLPEAAVTRMPPGLRLLKRTRPLLVSAAAHGAAGVRRAQRAGCDIVLLSPVLPTLSHPGGATLGRVRFAALTHGTTMAVAALGGLGPASLRQLNGARVAGVAGIGFASSDAAGKKKRV